MFIRRHEPMIIKGLILSNFQVLGPFLNYSWL